MRASWLLVIGGLTVVRMMDLFEDAETDIYVYLYDVPMIAESIEEGKPVKKVEVKSNGVF